MAVGPQLATTAAADRAGQALTFVHALLQKPEDGPAGLDELLGKLSDAFAATGAGLARGNNSVLAFAGPSLAAPSALPWANQPDLLNNIRQAPTALTVAQPGGPWLCASVLTRDAEEWVLWVQGGADRTWTPAEAAALALAGQALARLAQGQNSGAVWLRQLERATQQRRLEDAAILTRRLAHDYGNVLTSVLGFTELTLAQVPGESPVKRYLTEVHRAVQQGAQFTNRLRLFARRPSPSGRTMLLSDALAQQKSRVAGWGPDVEYTADLPRDLPAVGMGPEQLHEVLGALLDNAREALDRKGAVTVTARRVALRRDEALALWGNTGAGDYIVVEVSDTGAGLSGDARSRLFREPFYTTKPRHRGLGLATVYGILHSQRGGFRLCDRPGGGVTAEVYLPVVVAAREVPALAEPVPAPASAAPPPASRARILVVDDDPLVLQMVRDALLQEGYKVQTASSASEALAAHTVARQQQPFGLVVSDVVMPQTSGVELARQLLTRDRGLRLLFMSGQVTEDYLNQDFAARGVELLLKPFRPDGLLRAVHRALTDPRPQGPRNGGPTAAPTVR